MIATALSFYVAKRESVMHEWQMWKIYNTNIFKLIDSKLR